MIGRNSPIEISRAIRAKQDARMMRDAIRDLDPFQTIFGIPCWMPENQQLAVISAFLLCEDGAT